VNTLSTEELPGETDDSPYAKWRMREWRRQHRPQCVKSVETLLLSAADLHATRGFFASAGLSASVRDIEVVCLRLRSGQIETERLAPSLAAFRANFKLNANELCAVPKSHTHGYHFWKRKQLLGYLRFCRKITICNFSLAGTCKIAGRY
jgi:hypothetical protein